MITQLTAFEKDALKEVVSIGAGNAATALSQMTGTKVTLIVPRVHLEPLETVGQVFGSPEKIITCVFLQCLGDLAGVLLFSFDDADALTLAQLLTTPPATPQQADLTMIASAIKETGTILSGNCVNALATFFNIKISITPPALVTDMAGAIIDNILIETAREANHALVVDTELHIINHKIKSCFFFVPDTASLKKLLALIKPTDKQQGPRA
ncbi:MAG: chemotaxis protein CheC [Deltaproteobacteria bacterium]|nr:chemotaxis protein CheC [Deltaproteobacteria bacterium]